jgi:hypothetical protein
VAKPDIPQPEERERQEQALKLRLGGATYAQIAAKLEYADKSGAFRAVQAVLDRQESEGAAALRKIEDARLDLLWLRAFTTAMNDNATVEVRAKAEARALNVHNARVKLHGLAAPQKLEVGVSMEEFVTRVEEDMRALGYPTDYAAPPLEVEDEPWSNL